MANNAWPAGLPSPLSEDDPAYEPYDGFVRSPMDTGPGKLRLRFTGVNDKLTFALKLMPAQRVTFWNWYWNTIQQVGQFDFTDLRTGVTGSYRFNKRPSEKYVAGDALTGQGWWLTAIVLDLV